MHLTRYQITYTALANAVLPGQLGSMIRGVFGETLMQLAPGIYQKFFHPDIPVDEVVGKYVSRDLPAPFIIYPAKRYDFVRQNQEIRFNFTLIGNYRQYEDIVFEVFNHIQNTGLNHGKVPVGQLQFKKIHYKHKENIYFNDFTPPEKKITKITIHFKTPIALNTKKQLITDFDFQRLFGYVYRRLFILDYLYDDRCIPENYPFDIKKFNIKPVEIQLTRQSIFRSPTRSEKYPMTGWKGKILIQATLIRLCPTYKWENFYTLATKPSLDLENINWFTHKLHLPEYPKTVILHVHIQRFTHSMVTDKKQTICRWH